MCCVCQTGTAEHSRWSALRLVAAPLRVGRLRDAYPSEPIDFEYLRELFVLHLRHSLLLLPFGKNYDWFIGDFRELRNCRARPADGQRSPCADAGHRQP